MSDRPPQSSWVSARVVVAESSIEGGGLFATTDLDIGDVVVHFGGKVVTDRPSTDVPIFLGCDAAKALSMCVVRSPSANACFGLRVRGRESLEALTCALAGHAELSR